MQPDMQRFYVEDGIEDQSNSALLEKSPRFHLKVHGLKQRDFEVLIYSAKWVYHT